MGSRFARISSCRGLSLTCFIAVFSAAVPSVRAQTTPGGAQVSQVVGAVKSVQTDSITVTPDTGNEATAKLSDSTRILRVPPGEKDLKNATPLQAQDLQPGDRVLVRGRDSADGSPMTALAVIVMKQSDVTARRDQERQDWQKRGVGGLVNAVDTATGTITISAASLGASRSIAVHTTKKTVLRRYAPNSVRFDEARPAPLDQIKPGDQLRARGARTADGNELTAEEIVSGSFRNIAGTVTGVDASAQSITVQDAIAKGTVVVKFAPDSQLKKLPAEMAQRIAMRLKAASGEPATGAGSTGSAPGTGSAPSATGFRPPASAGSPGGGWQGAGGPGGFGGDRGNGGPPDFQRMLSRLPAAALSDLQKGDAVMIVSTAGMDAGNVTAITLLAGVEPILTSTSTRNASTILSPWSLGTGNGESAAEQ